jgi:hypothetical protein
MNVKDKTNRLQDKPLRNPGQSLDKELRRLPNDKLLLLFFLPPLLWILSGVSSFLNEEFSSSRRKLGPSVDLNQKFAWRRDGCTKAAFSQMDRGAAAENRYAVRSAMNSRRSCSDSSSFASRSLRSSMFIDREAARLTSSLATGPRYRARCSSMR